MQRMSKLVAVGTGVIALLLATVARPPGNALAYPGADNVTVYQQCAAGNEIQVGMTWTTYNLGAQWIDVSLNDNNFAAGTFVSNGPLAANVSQVVGPHIQPGITLYVRVNTQTSTGWAPSATVAFKTMTDCTNAVIVPVPAAIPVPVPAPFPVPVPLPITPGYNPPPTNPPPAPPGSPPMVTPY
jgi:hypothetical protein